MSNINLQAVQDTFVFLETFEKVLNLVGYVPYLGSVSAVVRDKYSNIEAIVGIAFGILATGVYLQGNPSRALFSISGTLIGHAILNQIRAQIEMESGLPLVTCLPYDLFATYYVGKRFFSYV